jgi:hypothetical protein
VIENGAVGEDAWKINYVVADLRHYIKAHYSRHYKSTTQQSADLLGVVQQGTAHMMSVIAFRNRIQTKY